MTNITSTVSRSMVSKKGREASPENPGWIPQSIMMVLPLCPGNTHWKRQNFKSACRQQAAAYIYLTMTQDRPTSCPAPRGMISTRSCCSGSGSLRLSSRDMLFDQMVARASKKDVSLRNHQLSLCCTGRFGSSEHKAVPQCDIGLPV